ncbi:MAG: hypothetical protein BTN85_1654 [Candidatus Methanohalarchaeum thermophilum]|uniref:Uncharacterized protein n=1 Tax=Methanohalarchaeum thermophilum TaxID=1903181 RepID=A0A1Q6DXR5_METT1|nr:MAG: hypothetical protein BTN85_1654 [Candidatus Methanohalarchaeum thermophilum]
MCLGKHWILCYGMETPEEMARGRHLETDSQKASRKSIQGTEKWNSNKASI